MFSERDHRGGGQTTEYGGEFIDTGHTAMLDLCGRFGLPLVDVLETAPKGARDVLHSDGRYRSYAQFVADFGPVYKALRADVDAAGAVVPKWDAATPAGVALSRLSVAEWISTRVPDGYSTWLGGFLDEAYTVEYGTEAADQTAVDLVYLLGDQADPANPTVWRPSDERLRVQGGNRQVPEAVAASLPSGSIEHGRRLKALARNNDGSQTLTFDIGGRTRTVRADHTILTVPIGVLKRIDHSRAGFDRRMRGAIAALGMGACAKLHVQVSSRVWQGHGRWPDVSTGSAFSDNGFQQVWDATPGRPGEQGIAIQYGGGGGARARSGPAHRSSPRRTRTCVPPRAARPPRSIACCPATARW
jgi:monoamine oxidase